MQLTLDCRLLTFRYLIFQSLVVLSVVVAVLI